MKKLKCIVIGISMLLVGCSLKQEEIKPVEQKIDSEEFVSKSESTLESEVVVQLPAPMNIKGSIDQSTHEITLSWDYEFPQHLEEDKYGEFYFVLCADDVYGGTHVFSYLPKNYKEVTFEIDSFTNTTLTRYVYLYAQQGIEEGNRISEKSDFFQYKETDAEPIPVTPFE